MRLADFWEEMRFLSKSFDLANHRFFRLWNQGELTEKEIGTFAIEYYHHIAAFPDYLRILEMRLPDNELRKQVSILKQEIEGERVKQETCAMSWLNLARAFAGNGSFELLDPGPEISRLIESCTEIVRYRPLADVLATFWCHESTIATLCRERSRGGRHFYAQENCSREFFASRRMAVIRTIEIWREQLNLILLAQPYRAKSALDAAENIVLTRWKVIDALGQRIRPSKTVRLND